MPGDESANNRPIGDGVEALNELAASEVSKAIDDVVDQVQGDVTEVQRLVEMARGSVVRDEPSNVQDAHQRMQAGLRRLGDDISAVISAHADELDDLRRRGSSTPAPAEHAQPTTEAPSHASSAAAAARAMLEGHPEVGDLVARLVADVTHPLDLTRALVDPHRRAATAAILAELADGRLLAGQTLDEYRVANPGRGRLFAPTPASALTTDDGRSRKKLFLGEARALDPVRGVGAEPTSEEFDLLDDYVGRLVVQVEPHVRAEIEAVAAPYPNASVSIRAKDPHGLIDKVRRKSTGNEDRPGRADYRIGEVVDAVGARITVADTTELATLASTVVKRYGIGEGGHVLDMENMYAEPKAHNQAYRVVPFIIGTSVGGCPYTFELQLSTRRASIAADLEHNTVYKPYVAVSDDEQYRVRGMQAEAAALDQDDTRNEDR